MIFIYQSGMLHPWKCPSDIVKKAELYERREERSKALTRKESRQGLPHNKSCKSSGVYVKERITLRITC